MRSFQLFNQYPYNTKKYKRYEKYFNKLIKQRPHNIKKLKKYLRLLNSMSTSFSAISLRTRFVYSEIMRENMDILYTKLWEEFAETENLK